MKFLTGKFKSLKGLSYPEYVHGIAGGREGQRTHQCLGRCHTDGLFCKFTSLVEAVELSQHMIFFEWYAVTLILSFQAPKHQPHLVVVA